MANQELGKIKVINEILVVSDKFKKRDVVITVELDSKYPQDVLFQLTNDKCDISNTFTVGSIVKVSYNLRGREWTSPQGEVKYFNTLEAWKLEAATLDGVAPEAAPAATAAPAAKAGTAAAQTVVVASKDDDDLPF